jgi:hypothetical protein
VFFVTLLSSTAVSLLLVWFEICYVLTIFEKDPVLGRKKRWRVSGNTLYCSVPNVAFTDQ